MRYYLSHLSSSSENHVWFAVVHSWSKINLPIQLVIYLPTDNLLGSNRHDLKASRETAASSSNSSYSSLSSPLLTVRTMIRNNQDWSIGQKKVISLFVQDLRRKTSYLISSHVACGATLSPFCAFSPQCFTIIWLPSFLGISIGHPDGHAQTRADSREPKAQ